MKGLESVELTADALQGCASLARNASLLPHEVFQGHRTVGPYYMAGLIFDWQASNELDRAISEANK